MKSRVLVQLAGRKCEEGCSWRSFSFPTSSSRSLIVVEAVDVVAVVVVWAWAVVVVPTAVVLDSN